MTFYFISVLKRNSTYSNWLLNSTLEFRFPPNPSFQDLGWLLDCASSLESWEWNLDSSKSSVDLHNQGNMDFLILPKLIFQFFLSYRARISFFSNPIPCPTAHPPPFFLGKQGILFETIIFNMNFSTLITSIKIA